MPDLNPTPAPRGRIALLDAVRVLGVAMVVGVHLLQKAGSPLGGGFGIPRFYDVTLGGLGVTILIVLSGLVTHLAYRERSMGWLAFMRRRAAHIYPTYWLCVGATVLMAGLPVLAGRGAIDYVLDLSGFLVFTGRSISGYILPTGWFIGLIVVLYALYPPLAWCLRRRLVVTLVVVLAISVASRLLVGSLWPAERFNDWVPMGRLFEFALGMWLAATPARVRALTGWFAPGDLAEHALSWAAAVSFPVFLVHRAVLDTWMRATHDKLLFVVLFGAVTLAVSEVVRRAALPAERWLRRTR